MMGRTKDQEQFCFTVRFDEHVRADHLLRPIDAMLTMSFVCPLLMCLTDVYAAAYLQLCLSLQDAGLQARAGTDSGNLDQATGASRAGGWRVRGRTGRSG